MSEAVINGARLFYEVHGDDKAFPLVLTHGLGSDHTMWLGQVPVFKNKYRLLIWDVRGHGRSEVTDDGYSIAQFVEDLYGLMQHVGITRAHVGGLSMGGWISWAFALAHPEATASLLLSDAAGITAGMAPEKVAEKQKIFAAGAKYALEHGRAAMADITVSMMFAPQFIRENPDTVDLVKKRIAADRGIGYARTVQQVFADYWSPGEKYLTDQLSSIAAPAIVIAGDQDQLTPIVTQKFLAQAIPGARLEIIPGSGHVPPIEKPETWNRIALEFLARVEV